MCSEPALRFGGQAPSIHHKIHLTGALPFWAGLGPGEVQQHRMSGRKEPLQCKKALGHDPAVPRHRALPREARRRYPHVQVAFETFCSFAVNSRGSLRTEISARTWPYCWQRPQSPAGLSPGRSRCHPRCHPCYHPCCGLCCCTPLCL